MGRDEVKEEIARFLSEIMHTLDDLRRVMAVIGIDTVVFDQDQAIDGLMREAVNFADVAGLVTPLLRAIARRYPATADRCAELDARYKATKRGHTANGHTANGHTANGHTANGHTANGHSLPPLPELLPDAPVESIGEDTPTVDDPASQTREAEEAPEIKSLRLDTAVPERVFVGQAFKLAVSVRQIESPLLADPSLPVVNSGDLDVLWQPGARFIRLRIQVSAPDCTIAGSDSDSFRLVAGRDSAVFLYHLTPKRQGAISIYVTVYQEEDRLGTAGVNTTALAEAVGETAAGSVKLVLNSQGLEDLFPADALKPLHNLLIELLGDNAQQPLLIAQQAGLEPARIERSSIVADQWWHILVAAHRRNRVAQIADVATQQFHERAADINAALAMYTAAAV